MTEAPTVARDLTQHRDARGNEVVGSTATPAGVRIVFRGSNNRIEIDDDANLDKLDVVFDCSDGLVEIGPSRRRTTLSVSMRVGQDSSVRIGRDVTCTEMVVFSAVEGTSITVGDDVMFASNNELRADDGHPIFDVRSGRRLNVSQSIHVGHHVWLARRAVVLAGGSLGNGSVLGYGAVLTRAVPNNCVAVGVPAKVVRRDIAWERPHLSLAQPYYKPDASTVRKSRFWDLTAVDASDASSGQRWRRRIRRTTVGNIAVRVRALMRRR